MTPSEKEKIIKEGFDAIRKVYNLRDDLLEDAGKLETVRESNRKLSDRVANLEVTIKTLNAAIDKKDVEIKELENRLKSLQATYESLERNRDNIYDSYLRLCHVTDADEEIKKQMIVDNRKKKEEIKSLKEELEAEKKIHCCDRCVCSVKKEYELLRKAHMKLCSDYNTLNENNAKLEDNFHELRERLVGMYMTGTLRGFSTSDFTEFAKWFNDTFGDFGVYDDDKEE